MAGSHIDTICSYVTRYSHYTLIALAVVIAALIARHLLRAAGRARSQHPFPRDTKPPA